MALNGTALFVGQIFLHFRDKKNHCCFLRLEYIIPTTYTYIIPDSRAAAAGGTRPNAYVQAMVPPDITKELTKKLSKEMEEVKKSMNFVSEDLCKVAKQQMGPAGSN